MTVAWTVLHPRRGRGRTPVAGTVGGVVAGIVVVVGASGAARVAAVARSHRQRDVVVVEADPGTDIEILLSYNSYTHDSW